MDYILEMAKVTDVEITAEELYAEPERKVLERVQESQICT